MAATWDPDQMRKQVWPWGDEWNKDNLHSPIGKGTVSVTSLPESGSAHGVLHLVGNVSEWTSSADLPYPYDAGDGREDTTTITDRIVRGSAYSALPETAAPTNRSGFSPATRDPFIGFRVVWDK